MAPLIPIITGLAVCLAAIGKEAYDSTGRGHVELLDASATVAGGALLVGVVRTPAIGLRS